MEKTSDDTDGSNAIVRYQSASVKSTSNDNEYYNMSHPERGMALIFNHMTFDSEKLEDRKGSDVDRDSLKNALELLKFKVTIYEDYTCYQLYKAITEAAEADHTNYDCFLVAVLSYGDRGILHAKDKSYEIETLCSNFTGDRCKTLIGKPKIFIYQACQGSKFDDGVEYCETSESNSKLYKIPTHADFLHVSSTVPGYYAWRNDIKGTWFIQALVKELKKNGKHMEIQEILTNVKQNVACNYESNTPTLPNSHKKKQMPETKSKLRYKLIFGEKE